MGWRGLVAGVAVLAAGIVGGFAAAAYLEAAPTTTGAPEPVIAADPRVPVDPPAPLREDPPQPALATGLKLREVQVGTDTSGFVFPAPRGWSRIETSSNEVKYNLADNPDNTYVLRVEQVITQHEQIPDILAATLDELERDQLDFKRLNRTYDSIEFSYVFDGYRRFGFLTWLDINRSGQAEAEIAVTGRERDVPGMRELIARVIRGIRAG